MKRLNVSVFRLTLQELQEATEVTIGGRVVGTWMPNTVVTTAVVTATTPLEAPSIIRPPEPWRPPVMTGKEFEQTYGHGSTVPKPVRRGRPRKEVEATTETAEVTFEEPSPSEEEILRAQNRLRRPNARANFNQLLTRKSE